MRKLWVFADFNWLKTPTLVGELRYESLRGADSYGFRFDEAWLSAHGNLLLSADLNNYTGVQYTQGKNDIFGCFADALPDRWGRTLLNRREQLLAEAEHRSPRRLSSFDYLWGIDDGSRMGGFRFKESPEGEYINAEPRLRIPPLADLRILEAACREIERSEAHNELPDQRWITQLLQPGSSLGGARPKANVVDKDGQLFIAKFPSRSDDYDAELWEHLCHLLATRAGISTAQTRVLKTDAHRHTLLSQRFDRLVDGRRVHFASAMTMLGLSDGDNATSGYGYLDMVDFIVQHCRDVEKNLRELYRRVAFNVSIGNGDDHFRNHGFLLTSKGWTLSPAYDINPSTNRHQSLLIDGSTNAANLAVLRAAANEYMLSSHEAEQIIQEVCEAMINWTTLARHIGIAPREIALFEERWRVE